MGLCVALTSGKGGTGKSTVSCGLAIAFSKMNKKVLLVDLDVGLRCIDMFFGIESNVVFDLFDAIESKEYDTAIYSVEKFENIHIVPAPKDVESIEPVLFSNFVDFVKDKYDVVIFDLPAGLSFSAFENVNCDIKYLCVTNLDNISVRDAFAVGECLEKRGQKPYLIINRFEKEYIKAGIYNNFDDIVDTSGIMLLGIVPTSSELSLFPIFHKVKKRGRAMKALTRIAKRLLGESILLPKPKRI